MIKVSKLISKDYVICFNLLKADYKSYNDFKNLGWSLNQFKNQLLKENNFSLGLFNNNILEGFLIGDTVDNKKTIEYEILLIYVKLSKRNLGYASNLLHNVPLNINNKKLLKIYLEVSENNRSAIELYHKHNYKKVGVRKKYYKIHNEKFDEYFFEKKINE